MLHRLEGDDGVVELDALLGVPHGRLQCPLSQAQRLGANAGAGELKEAHRLGEAHTLPADKVLGGDEAVLKYQFSGGRAADAHLLLFTAKGEAGGVLLHLDGAGAADAPFLIG